MYNNNFNNPYYVQQQKYQQQLMPQNDTQYVPQYTQVGFTKPSGLQGKQVDSVEVVKATDVPFDGSISYFPLTDNSAIVTKQLQTDGTSKIVVFRPVDEQKEEIKYITQDELKNALDNLNFDEIDDIKEEIRELRKEFKDLKKK